MTDNAKYITVTDDTFEAEVLRSAQPVMVDFWAAWCAPCRIMAPVIEELAAEYEGKIRVGKLDVDANPQTAGEYGIRSIPTLLFFSQGAVVARVIGVVSKQELTNRVEKLLSPE